jgi:signal transduction histidine kinase
MGAVPNSGPAVLALMLLVACVAVSFDGSATAAAPEQISVLILLPGQSELPAASAIATGIRASLVSARSFPISIATEHVDTDLLRAPGDGERHQQEMYRLYRSKFAGRPFDLIFVALNEPLGFVLRARDDIWPGTPVIACAVDERTLGGFTPPAGMVIATIRYDMEGTIRAALGLLPDTRHVALVGGIAPLDRTFHDLGRQAVQAFGGRLDLIDLTALSIEDLMTRVSVLPPDTIVLASSFQMDGAGRRFYGVDIAGPISTTSNRPMFSVFGTVLGRGIVGGSLVDFEAVGREAGGLGLRALRGEPLASVVTSAAANVLRFDGRELQRWRLDERRLPLGSEVVHREPTLWQQYHWHIVGTVVLVTLQMGLIAGLWLERRHGRQTQERLAERLRFEALVAEISATFAGLPTARVDEHIVECLRRVVIFLGVDRAALWRQTVDGTSLSATHSWTAVGVEPAPAANVLGDFPRFRRLTEQGREISFSHPDDVPAESVPEREFFVRVGIRSFATIPLKIGDRSLGFLTFVSFRAERAWPDDVMRQVRTLAELFANALSRKEAATALASSEAFTGAVLAALPGETAIIDSTGVIVQVNEAWARFAGTVAGDAASTIAVGDNYLTACRGAVGMPAESARKTLDLIAAVLQGQQEEGALEYPFPRAGDDRWFEVRVRRVARPGGGAAIMHFDVTARRRAEATARAHLSQVAHMDRVFAMGELASSIAHELNQPLTAILSNAQAARRLLAVVPPDVGELLDCLTDIVNDDRRAGEVLRRMRRLLKKADFQLSLVNLNDVAEGAIALVASDALLHYVQIEFVPARGVPAVYADSVQIQQVVLNLLANAISAAAAAPTAVRMVIVWTGLTEDGHVELGVHDSGKGIPESDLPRVFEPFFTTKAEGLGMGLAITRSIVVEAHGGRISAENDVTGGATFRVHLPVGGPEQ